MADPDALPTGVRVSLTLYLRSDAEGLSSEVSIADLPYLPPASFMASGALAERMMGLAPSGLARDWRPMTDEEIDAYSASKEASSHG